MQVSGGGPGTSEARGHHETTPHRPSPSSNSSLTLHCLHQHPSLPSAEPPHEWLTWPGTLTFRQGYLPSLTRRQILTFIFRFSPTSPNSCCRFPAGGEPPGGRTEPSPDTTPYGLSPQYWVSSVSSGSAAESITVKSLTAIRRVFFSEIVVCLF